MTERRLIVFSPDWFDQFKEPDPCAHCGRLVLIGVCCRAAVPNWTDEEWERYIKRGEYGPEEDSETE